METPGECFCNKYSCENLKPKLFHLRLLASLCNFNYLQSFVKAKFTVVKYNSKMSITFHQIKFWKGIMNRSSIKKGILKSFLIFTEKYLCCSLFLNKNAGLQSWNFIKKRLKHKCFPVNTVLRNVKSTCFKEYLWTTVWTFCYMSK